MGVDVCITTSLTGLVTFSLSSYFLSLSLLRMVRYVEESMIAVIMV